jgi:hypothetical protein
MMHFLVFIKNVVYFLSPQTNASEPTIVNGKIDITTIAATSFVADEKTRIAMTAIIGKTKNQNILWNFINAC